MTTDYGYIDSGYIAVAKKVVEFLEDEISDLDLMQEILVCSYVSGYTESKVKSFNRKAEK